MCIFSIKVSFQGSGGHISVAAEDPVDAGLLEAILDLHCSYNPSEGDKLGILRGLD